MRNRFRIEGPPSRGFAAIGLIRPGIPENVGGVMRAAFCYSAAMIAIQGARYRRPAPATDTPQAWKKIPLLEVEDLFAVLPFGCVAVAVDLLPGATALPVYHHPERAMYIFGPENGTLGSDVTERCHSKIAVPTQGCMNLAASVNVVLYDRAAKRWNQHRDSDDITTALSLAG